MTTPKIGKSNAAFVNEDSESDRLCCPICKEEFDIMDLKYESCPCGYQICVWCSHNIKHNLDDKCPSCLLPFSKDFAQKIPNHQRLELLIEKQKRDRLARKESASKKNLHDARIVQKNLVYVIGIPQSMAKEEIIRREQVFGKYGKIHKLVFNRSYSSKVPNAEDATVGCYLTYFRPEDAANAIMHIDGSLMEGKHLRASYGTTKYCSNFIKGVICGNPDCMFLHELAPDSLCIMKDEMNLSNKKAKQFQDMIRPQDAKKEVMASIPKDPILAEGNQTETVETKDEKSATSSPTSGIQRHSSRKSSVVAIDTPSTTALPPKKRAPSLEKYDTASKQKSSSTESTSDLMVSDQELNCDAHPQGNVSNHKKSPLSGFCENDPVVPWSDSPDCQTCVHGAIGRTARKSISSGPQPEGQSFNHSEVVPEIWRNAGSGKMIFSPIFNALDSQIGSMFPNSLTHNHLVSSFPSPYQMDDQTQLSTVFSPILRFNSPKPEGEGSEQSHINNLTQLVGVADYSGMNQSEAYTSADSVYHAMALHSSPLPSTLKSTLILRDEVWRTGPGPILSIGSPCDAINHSLASPHVNNPLMSFSPRMHNSPMVSPITWSAQMNHSHAQSLPHAPSLQQYGSFPGLPNGIVAPPSVFTVMAPPMSPLQQSNTNYVTAVSARSMVSDGGRGFYDQAKSLASTPEAGSMNMPQLYNSALQGAAGSANQRNSAATAAAPQGSTRTDSGQATTSSAAAVATKVAVAKGESGKATAASQQANRVSVTSSSQKSTSNQKAETQSTTKPISSAKRLSMGSTDDPLSTPKSQASQSTNPPSLPDLAGSKKDEKSPKKAPKAPSRQNVEDAVMADKTPASPSTLEQTKTKGKANSKSNQNADALQKDSKNQAEFENESNSTLKGSQDVADATQETLKESMSIEERAALEQELERKRVRKLEKKIRLQKEKEEKAKEREKEKLREMELEKEREKEREAQRQRELEEKERKEKERQAQKEKERQKKREMEAEQERIRLEELNKKETEKKEKERLRQVEKEKRERQMKEKQLKEHQVKEQQLKEQQLREHQLVEQQLMEHQTSERISANSIVTADARRDELNLQTTNFAAGPAREKNGDAPQQATYEERVFDLAAPPFDEVVGKFESDDTFDLSSSDANTLPVGQSSATRKDNKRARRRQKQKEKLKQKQPADGIVSTDNEDMHRVYQPQPQPTADSSTPGHGILWHGDDYPQPSDDHASEPDVEDYEYEEGANPDSIISRITKALMANRFATDLPSQISFLQRLDVPDENRLLNDILMMARDAAERSMPLSVSCLQELQDMFGISLHENELGAVMLDLEAESDGVYRCTFSDPNIEVLEDSSMGLFLRNKYMGPEDFLTLADSFSSSGSSADLCDDELHPAYSTGTELQLLEEEVLNARKEASMLGGMLLEVISRNASAPLATM